ncbi:fatty acid desaturase [Acinetobacter junii]|uniref:fatty acid desaturase family protein n=1 Tax=Acinetobacter junii TaxID=40215 RepID=UPI0024485433|nr:fatty acid desaturase [Acinetobacter junii]MDH1916179.1 fatty acid desaturase [Acinetobacter junii]
MENSALKRFPLVDLRSRSNDVTFGLKLTIYLILLGTGGSCALSGNIYLTMCGIVLLGAMFAHGVELQHQVLHGQGFHHRKLNEFVGIVLGLPMLVSYADYQYSHLHHHKYLGTPENREYFDYGDQYGELSLKSISSLLNRLFMLAHYPMFLKNIFIALLSNYKDVPKHVSKKIKRDYLTMLLMIMILSALSIWFRNSIILYIWLCPLLLVAAPIHALIEMPEHFRCDTNSIDPFRNTRTIKSNAFMNWFTNGNNYHVEHHLMPGLPIDRLHDLHEKIKDKNEFQETTYRDFYLGLFKSMVKK